MSLLQMSFSGAVMIAVIAAVRALAVNRLPKRAFLALWGAALARLLLPFSLPSPLCVYALLTPSAPAAKIAGGAPAAQVIPAVPAAAVPAAPAAPAAVPPAAAAVPATPAVGGWTLVWLLGMLACGTFFALAWRNCRREFATSLPVDSGYAALWLERHRLRRTVELRQSGRISAPLTYGVFRPVILMPKTTDWDDRDTLRYVLTHEHVHIRRFDAVSKLVLTAALCVHWFNPAVWLMYVLANRDMELSCDEAVVRLFGEETKPAYARTLIRMEEIRSGLTPLSSGFSKSAIEERITAIMKMKKASRTALIAAVILVAGVTSAFATSPWTGTEKARTPAAAPAMEAQKDLPSPTAGKQKGLSAPAEVTAGRMPAADLKALPAEVIGLEGWQRKEDAPAALLAETGDLALYGLRKPDGQQYALLRWGDAAAEFDWHFSGPRIVEPRLWSRDVDGDGAEEAVVVNYVGGGTGVSIEDLHIVERDGGILTDHRLPDALWRELLTEALGFRLEEDRVLVTLGDQEANATAEMPDISPEDIRRFSTGEICEFELAPSGGLRFRGSAALEAENVPHTTCYVAEITADIAYRGGVFTLDGFRLQSYFE